MSVKITELSDADVATVEGAGLGALTTPQGNLPLAAVDLQCRITGLSARTVMTQRFRNPHAESIEATYIFPLPERGAVTNMTMAVGGRTVIAELHERAEARQRYDSAIKEGKSASIAEAERADVFTMRVGNIPADEEAVVTLTIDGPLAYEDNEATLRFPLVVAPRYIPGEPVGTAAVGDGYAEDTDAVPDASRITPPVLLPGFPNPVQLSIEVVIDPAGLPLDSVRSSLHAVTIAAADGDRTTVRIEPGSRVNRDFVLRLSYGQSHDVSSALVLAPDSDDRTRGTFQLTALPPRKLPAPKPRDLVVLLDRSGSMNGWKMVAARRAAARIVDTLSSKDKFAVRCFDTELSSPQSLDGNGLSAGTDRNRFHAVEHLAGTNARGGTDILTPLSNAVNLLGGSKSGRDRIIVLVTDGQVGNEDQILQELHGGLKGIRVHVVGIDKAVNAGFLHRLALQGKGRCELVESHDRLDEATAHIHRRIVAPVVTDVSINAEGFTLEPDSLTPQRQSDLFSGAPFVIAGRYHDATANVAVELNGTKQDGSQWNSRLESQHDPESSTRVSWARAHLRDLEDQYACAGRFARGELEKRIVDLSLKHRVLSRFTAFVAVDQTVVTEGGKPRTIVQPVELPAGWETAPSVFAPPTPSGAAPGASPAMMMGGAGPRGHDAAGPRAGGPAFARPAASAPAAAPSAKESVPRSQRVGKSARKRRSGGLDAEQIRAILLDELQVLDPEMRIMVYKAPEVVAHERRTSLSDLATRLGFVVDAMAELTDFDDAKMAQLRELLPNMRACEHADPPQGAALEELWNRTIVLLRELSAEAAPDSAAVTPDADAESTNNDTATSADAKDDVPFWKR